jgi:2-amino-4-hydroxy-6-hydroxymethyldihydropteridine diphosphokinase
MNARRDVYLGLGANLGDRHARLRAALVSIAGWRQTAVGAVSGVYASSYVGPGGAQPDYLNLCVRIHTALPLEEIFAAGQMLEREAGRVRGGHMEPRTLDVDILYDAAGPCRTASLEVPHPRMLGRRFVLAPLAEVGADLELDEAGRRAAELDAREELQAQQIRRIADAPVVEVSA